jgi:peptidoglycan-associated lipoprotein
MEVTHHGALFKSSSSTKDLTNGQNARILAPEPRKAKKEYIMTKPMMSKLVPALVIGVSLITLSACTKKVRPGDLPDVPMGTGGGVNGQGGQGGQGPFGGPGGRGAPGSQQDFVSNIVADRIYFDTSQSNVDAEDAAVLDSQIAWLNRYPNKRIVIEGHCDERGTRDYNLALGARRANAAKNYLVARGVNPARIQTISYGKERPEAMGSDAESWARNRRAVTVTVM